MSNVIKDKNKNKGIKLNKSQKKEYYYAVKKGHTTGIFPNWDACKNQVIGFPGALYKKFDNINDAKKYLVSSFMRSSKKKSSKSNDLDSLDDKNKLNVQKVMSAKKIASLLKKGTIMLQTNTHENLKKKNRTFRIKTI